MRPIAVGFALVTLAAVAACATGCSRTPPSPSAATPDLAPPAVAVAAPSANAAPAAPSATATLRLATAIEEPAADAGAPSTSASSSALTGKVVLHVGDSMVGGNQGLTRALEQRFAGEGAKFIRDYKVSESIVSYDHSSKLKDLVAKHHPDIVLITLGTNDVFVPYPASMAGNVQNIVKRVGARECYWLGPPTWKPDTGIVQVLRENVAPCKFYDASSLKLQRAGDGIHPTDRGGADWAASFWAFFRPGSGGADAPLLGDAGAP
jgi:acyl-CoA thioesterase-1